MADILDIIIIGSGPAGLSAAARAAERGLSHLLLERAAQPADTIFKYQRGKFIMATPDVLPLQSPLKFSAGLREGILETWQQQIDALKIQLRLNAEVVKISGAKGNFTVALKDGSECLARHIILAIGVQGNLRTIKVEGATREQIQYQLDDPAAYPDEAIAVVGAGDAAIENAVALAAAGSKVVLVNRRNEFARAKTGNQNAIMRAAETGQLSIAYNAAPQALEGGELLLKTDTGTARYPCDRIIARLGADPPRKFVESCGVKFGSPDPGSFPEVSPQYESTTEGLYIVGALAGYPLIKHCINQGYEVVEHIAGAKVVPADEPLLQAKFSTLPTKPSVQDALQQVQKQIALLAPLSLLQLREFMLASSLHVMPQGATVFNANDYGDSLFCILEGGVAIKVGEGAAQKIIPLAAGQFFGEVGLISGRRRSATIVTAKPNTALIEIPRQAALKLLQSVPAVKAVLDETVALRQLQTVLGAGLTAEDLAPVLASAEPRNFSAGEILIKEGDNEDNSVVIIRTGSVTVQKRLGGRDITLSYIPAGRYVGEMALLRGAARSATVTAAIATETLRIDGATFRALLDKSPQLLQKLEATVRERALHTAQREQSQDSASGLTEFLVAQGIGEATDILLIDESLCIRCDNCEKACATTHGGVSRLDREAGPTFAMVHVPTSCRHCEHPHCMSDCPPDAIHRAANGEVFIDQSCIGCGNCERNCPYGVIHMAAEAPKNPGLLSWLLWGAGDEKPLAGKKHKPADKKDKTAQAKKAVKCDMCGGIDGGPACVRACPTGAALRVSPEQFLNLARGN